MKKGNSFMHELVARNVGDDLEWVHIGLFGSKEKAMAHVFETVASSTNDRRANRALNMTINVSTSASVVKKTTSIVFGDPVKREREIDEHGRVTGSRRVAGPIPRVWEYRIQLVRVNAVTGE